MSMDSLFAKLAEIRANPSGGTFILADARDADMSWGIPSFGKARSGQGFRSAPAFLEEIRAVVHQGFVDILLASASTMDTLAHKERLFDGTHVTPAVRINDATDIWCQRGARYRESPSAPFRHGLHSGSAVRQPDRASRRRAGRQPGIVFNDVQQRSGSGSAELAGVSRIPG